MKSLLIAFGCILTTFIVLLHLITRGADTTQTKLVFTPVKPELFTPFAKPPISGRALRYRVRSIGNYKDRSSHEIFTPTPSLPTFRPPPDYTSAVSIAKNSHQQVVGRLCLVNSGTRLQIRDHGFLHSNGVMYDLGTLPAYQNSDAVAINNHGAIAGCSQEDSMDGGTPCHAVCWIHRKIRDLGIGHALSISNSGDIVGDSSSGQNFAPPLWTADPEDYDTFRNGISSQALLWTHGYRYDLNNRIPSRSGWILTSATGINDKGRIVGHGLFHGRNHAFLLTPTTK